MNTTKLALAIILACGSYLAHDVEYGITKLIWLFFAIILIVTIGAEPSEEEEETPKVQRSDPVGVITFSPDMSSLRELQQFVADVAEEQFPNTAEDEIYIGEAKVGGTSTNWVNLLQWKINMAVKHEAVVDGQRTYTITNDVEITPLD